MRERIHIEDRRPGDVPLGALALSLVLLLPLGVWVVQSQYYRPSLCGLKAAVGLPCLTCGSTRATLYLFDGDLMAALAHQPMMMLIYLVFTLWGIVSLGAFAVGKRVRIDLHPRVDLALKIALITIPIANWVYLIWAGI